MYGELDSACWSHHRLGDHREGAAVAAPILSLRSVVEGRSVVVLRAQDFDEVVGESLVVVDNEDPKGSCGFCDPVYWFIGQGSCVETSTFSGKKL